MNGAVNLAMNLAMNLVVNRVLPALLLALLAAACAPQALDSSARFSPGGEDALVVMGTALQRDGVRPWRGTLGVVWSRYDPRAGTTTGEHFGVESETTVQARFLWPKDAVRDLTAMRHSVHRVVPGDYVLSRFSLRDLHEAQVTWFLAPERSALARRPLGEPETVTGAEAPRVRIAAGEIVYIGDFVFTPSHPDDEIRVWRTQGTNAVWIPVPDLRMRVASWRADEAAAARTLAAFRGVEGELVMRRPERLPAAR